MSSDRSRQVEEVYRAALERSGESREALLSALDPVLRAEVEVRLSSVSPPEGPPLTPGTIVSVYRIEDQLGEGGMGVVYRALDTRLNRPVAVKFLTKDLADAAARRRFQREAQLASSLNHPHIVAVFDIGEFEQRQYVVTEFIDGGTLRQWIGDRKPWRQTVELLTSVADGLAAAHSLNILHRDIKPENILLTRSGYAKLGDFGLAKLAEPADDPSAATRSLGHNSTRKGVTLGTPAYMSPEQASGQELDSRSDVFSFGVLLHEALSGQRPFAGSSEIDLLHQVIHADPQPLSDALPVALRMVVEKALQKDPNERYQSMRDLVVDLRHVVRRASSAVAPPATAPSVSTVAPSTAVNSRVAIARWVGPAVAGVALLAVGVTAGLYFRPSTPVADAVRLQIPLPPNTTFTVSGSFAISPDGKKLVFGALGADNEARFWLRALDSVETKPLEGTTHDPRNSTVFWSPDSRMVAYYTGGTLHKVDVSGGGPQRIGEVPQPVGGFWGPDGVILLGSASGIVRVDAESGATSPATTRDADRQELAHAAPVLLPDGKHFLYGRASQSAEYRGLFVGSLDVKPEEQSLQALLPSSVASAMNAAYTDSQLWYYRAGSVVAQPFDLARLALAGEPARVVDQVDSNPGVPGFFPGGAAYFSVSSTGVLVYRFGGATVNRQPTWFDRHWQDPRDVWRAGVLLHLQDLARRKATGVRGPRRAIQQRGHSRAGPRARHDDPHHLRSSA
jgi:eukaryotic-like serine/threonine-protein kinase